jgi:hypothetical protein
MSASTTSVFALSGDEVGAQQRRVISELLLGTILEKYDFSFYGSLAQTWEGRS